MQAADASFIYEPEPCRGASDSNGNWYPLMPTLEEQNRFRRLEINRHWNKYQKGQYKKSTGRLASSVYMFKPNEIQVFKTHHAYTDEIINIHVSVKDPENRPDVNFFGYNSHEPCIAFRGQACHFSSFFALAHLLAAADKVELFYKSPSEVKFPPEGLQPNLTYEEFAGEIEIVEYVAWLKDGDTQTAGTMSLLNFLDRNSPLLRPRLIELGLQQSQNGNDDQSVGELTSPPSLQLDEGSEIHEQEQSPTTSSSVGDNSGRDHRISEDQTISATTTPLISPGNNDDISGNESMTSTSNNIQFSDKESQILEEQVNPTAVTSISPMLLDANDEEAYPSPNVDGNPGSPWSLFGDGEEQESEGPPNSRSQSPLTDVDPEDILHRSTQEKTHVLISVESASQEQENPSAEQHGASKEKNNSSIEQKTQQDYDAEMAAELQRTNRYSLRSRTPSTSITNSLDWTKSSQSSTTKQQTSSARGKSVPQIKKPRKKGFGKRVTKR